MKVVEIIEEPLVLQEAHPTRAWLERQSKRILQWLGRVALRLLRGTLKLLFKLLHSVAKAIGKRAGKMFEKFTDALAAAMGKIAGYVLAIALTIAFTLSFAANDYSLSRTFSWEGIKTLFETFQ